MDIYGLKGIGWARKGGGGDRGDNMADKGKKGIFSPS
jgi:hypothetical protein